MAIGYLPPPPPRAPQSLSPKPLEAVTPAKRKALPPIPKTLLTQGQIAAGQARVEAVSRELTNQQVQGTEYLKDISTSSNINDEFDKLSKMLDSGQPINNAVDSDGTNPFMKVLGGLGRTLAYIDIPFELGVEAIEGAIPGKWWGEGTAERQDFEGWKALGKMFRGEQGLIDTANEIADAFEKRPLLAQLGIGIVGGVGVANLSKVRYLKNLAGGRALKPIQYTLDPGQILWDVGVKGVRAARGLRKSKLPTDTPEPTRFRAMPTTEDIQRLARIRAGTAFIGGGSGTDDLTRRLDEFEIEIMKERYVEHEDEVFGRVGLMQDFTTYFEFARLNNIPWVDEGLNRTLNDVKADIVNHPNYKDRGERIVDELLPIHQQVNALHRLRRHLAQTAGDTTPDSQAAFTPSGDINFPRAWETMEAKSHGATLGTIEHARGVNHKLTNSRNLAMLDLQQAVHGRPGELERISLSDLEDYVTHGRVSLEQITGQAAGGRAIETVATGSSPTGMRYQSQVSALMYINELKRTVDPASGDTLYNIMKAADAQKATEGFNISVWDTSHANFRKGNTVPDADKYSYDRIDLGIRWLDADNNLVFDNTGKQFKYADLTFDELVKTKGLKAIGMGDIPQRIGDTNKEALMLTNWIRHWNGHYTDIIERRNILPDEAQPLRGVAATAMLASLGRAATPAEIASILLHSVGSGDTYLSYIWDAQAHDVRSASANVLGLGAYNATTHEMTRGGAGLLERMTGLKTKGYRMTKVEDPETGEIVKGPSETARREGMVELTTDSKLLIDLENVLKEYGSTPGDGAIYNFNTEVADILGTNTDELLAELRELRYPELSRAVEKGKKVTGIPRKGLRVKGRTFLIKEMDDLAYIFMSIAHKKILKQMQRTKLVDYSAVDKPPIILDSPMGEIVEDVAMRHVEYTGAKADFNLWRDLDIGPEEASLLDELAAFSTMQQEVINATEDFWRLDMHKDLIKSVLARSGWIENVNGKMQLRTNAKGELEAFRGKGGGKAFGHSIQGMDEWARRFGSGAEISPTVAWKLFGGMEDVDGLIRKQLGDSIDISSDDFIQSLTYLEKTLGRRKLGQLHDHEMAIIGTWGVQQRLFQKILNFKAKQAMLNSASVGKPLGSVLAIAEDFGVPSTKYDGILNDAKLMDIVRNGVREFEHEVEVVDMDWLKVLSSIGGGWGNLGHTKTSATSQGLSWAAVGQLRKFDAIYNKPTGRADLIGLEEINVQGGGFGNAQAVIRQWLGAGETDRTLKLAGQQVVEALALAGIKRGKAISDEDMMLYLERVFEHSDGAFFGTDVMGRGLDDVIVQRRLENVALVLLQDDRILIDAHFPRQLGDVNFSEESLRRGITVNMELPRRGPATEEGVTLNLGGSGNAGQVHVTSKDFIGNIPRRDISSMIRSFAQDTRIGRKMLGLDAEGNPLPNRSKKNKAMGAVARAMGGGAAQGGLSRIAKIFVSRKKSHAIIDQSTQDMTAQLQLMLNEGTGPGGASSLGYTTDAASPHALIDPDASATKEGHQLFSKLIVNDVEFEGTKVIGWTDRTKPAMSKNLQRWINSAWEFVAENANLQGNRLDVDKESVGEVMIRATVDANTAEHVARMADLKKALTLVDVPLRLLSMDDIEQLYHLVPAQRQQLLLLRNLTEQVDARAAGRGYNVRAEVEKSKKLTARKEGKNVAARIDYAEEGMAYIPWSRRRDMRVRQAQLDGNTMSGPVQSWLLPRQDEDLFKTMLPSDTRRGDVMDDMIERYAFYHSDVMKTVIDREIGQQMHLEFVANIPSKLTDRKAKDPVKEIERRRKLLRDLGDVVDAKGIPGLRIAEGGFRLKGKWSIKKLLRVKHANWDWVSPELRNHIEELYRPMRANASPSGRIGTAGMPYGQLFERGVGEKLFEGYAEPMGGVVRGREGHMLGVESPQGDIFDTVKHATDNYDEIKRLINDDIKDYNEFLTQTTVKPFVNLGPGKEAIFSTEELGREQWLNAKMRLGRDDVDEIISQLRPLQEGIGGAITKASLVALPVARLMRVMKAGMDLGVMMIHGFNALTRMPLRVEDGSLVFDASSQKAWYGGFKNMIKMAANPDYLEEFMAQTPNRNLRRRIAPFVELGGVEPLEAGRQDMVRRMRRRLSEGWFGQTKLDPRGLDIPLARPDGRGLMHRAEASFVGGLDTLRMKMWESLEPIVEREFNRAAAQDPSMGKWVKGNQDYIGASKYQLHALTELGATVNKMTGVYDKNMAGLTPTQGAFENAFIFFAPTYRRAVMGIIGDITRRGAGDLTVGGVTKRTTTVRNREALRQLSGVVMAGAIYASVSEWAFDNDGATDPSRGSFMKMKVGDASLGIGTAWYTAFRLAGDIAMASYNDPEGDVYETIKDNPLTSALLRRSRSQASPIASFLTDAIQGSTFMGDPLRDPDGSQDWSALLAHGGASVAYPFWLDGIFHSVRSDPTSATLVGVSELFGLQSYPTSTYDKYLSTRQWVLDEEDSIPELNVWRNQRRASGEALDWDTLPALLKRELENGSIPLVEAYNEYKDDWGDRARGDDRLWVQYSSRKGQIDLQAKKQLANWTTQFEKGMISGRDLNQRIKEVKNYRRSAHQDIFADPQFHPIMDVMNKRKKEKNDIDDFRYQGDIIYDAYLTDVIAAEDNFDEEGNWLIDNYKRNLGTFRSQWDMAERPGLWQYVQDRKNHWFSDNPIMEDLEQSKVILNDYWNMHNTIFVGEERRMAKKYMTAPTTLQKAILKAGDRRYVDIERKMAAARLKWRKSNPHADSYLVKYYGLRPVTDAAKNLETRWYNRQMQAQSTGDVSTLSAGGYSLSPAGRVLHSSLTDEL